MRQRIALLGSTGSIGEQTLDVAADHAELFEVVALTAHRNWRRLAEQARTVLPDSVAIADKAFYPALKEALADLPIKVYAGSDAVAQLAAAPGSDTVVNALVGYAGLAPSVETLRAGKKLALANKESLVVAGERVMELVEKHRAPLVPIDSEHSALLQCLAGERSAVRRLILTASGGALRDLPAAALEEVTPEQALRHPNWQMGAKITIDSATLVNKGFEVIEARWLFGVEADRIDVLIHPQSIIHSMVEFMDGSVKAQLGTPDMRLPIQYALTFPDRLGRPTEPFPFLEHPELTFRAVDRRRYPALDLAYDCLRRGGNACCVMNGANEVAVAAFLEGRIGFLDIVRTIERTLDRVAFEPHPDLSVYDASDKEARRVAASLLVKEKSKQSF